ncbi:hypothetical protein [Streptomyces sp. NPDC054838]
MDEQRFTPDNSGVTPAFRHNLRFEDHSEVRDWQVNPAQGRRDRVLTGETTATCTCGLDTGAVPSDEARLVYEEHRNLIRDEIATESDG